MAVLPQHEVEKLRAAVGAGLAEGDREQFEALTEALDNDLVTRIRRLRQERRLSVAELAKRCGMASVRIASYERGQRQPTVAALAEIYDALGYDLVVVPRGTDRDAVSIPDELRRLADRIEAST